MTRADWSVSNLIGADRDSENIEGGVSRRCRVRFFSFRLRNPVAGDGRELRKCLDDDVFGLNVAVGLNDIDCFSGFLRGRLRILP